jgi:phosphoribosylamine--glycine ligase
MRTSRILTVLMAASEGKLKQLPPLGGSAFRRLRVMAAEGYPWSYAKGDRSAAAKPTNSPVKVFHAGTSQVGDQVVTDGAACWASPRSATASPPRSCGPTRR